VHNELRSLKTSPIFDCCSKDVSVPVGGMVQEALNLTNEEDAPPTLRVLRPFHGHLIPIKFDGPSRDLRKLALLPGDQITFQVL